MQTVDVKLYYIFFIATYDIIIKGIFKLGYDLLVSSEGTMSYVFLWLYL